MEDKFKIDFVSDVVCPWCIIGLRQLEQALNETGISAQIRFHPFELNPHMAPEGENLREHLAAKYGTTLEDSRKARERLTALGADLGFTFSYTDDMRMVNTFRAHQIIHWAGTKGHAHDMKMALFGAFFTDRCDLNDPQVLAEHASKIGLDRDEALAVLNNAQFAQAVRENEQFWTSRGIQGVPAIIFKERYLLSGAQGVENYRSILTEIAEPQDA